MESLFFETIENLKNSCRRFDPQFLEERSQALQSFLVRVLVEIPVTSSEAMMEFLEVTHVLSANQRVSVCTWKRGVANVAAAQ